LNLVCLFKRYLHKWPKNSPFLPVPPAKQANYRSNLCNYYLFSPVYQTHLFFLCLELGVLGDYILCVSAVNLLRICIPYFLCAFVVNRIVFAFVLSTDYRLA